MADQNLPGPSKRFQSEPTLSKFQKYGKLLVEDLEAFKDSPNSPFYSYQVDAVLLTRRLLKDEEEKLKLKNETAGVLKPALIVAPTGSGKTGIIAMLPFALEAKAALMITPAKDLSVQLKNQCGPSRKCTCYFEKVDYLTNKQDVLNMLERARVVQSSADVLDPTDLGNLVIVNAQRFSTNSKVSLVYNNKDVIEDVEYFFSLFDLLIVDEAHHFPAQTWAQIVKYFSKKTEGMTKKIVFMTATPFKNDKKGEMKFIMDDFKDRIVINVPKAEVEGITVRRCEFRELDTNAANIPKNLATDIKEVLNKQFIAENRFIPQAMVLVRTRKEAKNLADNMNKEQCNPNFAVALLGANPGKDKNTRGQRSALDDFTVGRFRVAVTCGIALEGYDNPKVTMCVILRNIVKGRILFAQFAGRCMRQCKRLPGGFPDRTVSLVLSYSVFGQRKMWDEMNRLAEHDPIDGDNAD